MPETLRWLITVEIIGLLTLPIAWSALPYLRDRGAGLSKPLGLILVGGAVWLLSDLGVLTNTGGAYWIVTAVVGALSIWILRGRQQRFCRFVRKEWPALLVGELLFLLFFAAWAFIRAHQPDISGTEKPMELLMLNAVSLSDSAPPVDPWLAGQPVAYYYFGYWILGGVGLMSGVATSIGFNLSLALIAGMAASAIFSVAYGTILSGRVRDRSAIPIAVFAAVLLLVASNYAGVWEFGAGKSLGTEGFYDWLAIDSVGVEGSDNGSTANSWRPDNYWWWWHSSRVINTFDAGTGVDFTIQEFPFFSLLLGDLHPHLIAIPFVLLAIGLILNLFLTPGAGRPGRLVGRPLQWLLLSISVGALGFINAWDLGFAAALIFIAATIKMYRADLMPLPFAVLRGFITTVMVLGLGMVIYAGFYFGTFSSQVDWSAPLGAAEYATRPIHMLTVWGLFVVLLAPLWLSVSGGVVRAYIGRFRANAITDPISENIEPAIDTPTQDANSNAAQAGRAELTSLIAVLLAIAAPYVVWANIHLYANDSSSVSDLFWRAIDVLPLAVLSGLSMLALLHFARRAISDTMVFALALLAMALYMVYGAELLYINDLFGGRMNTVFKLYYQVWIIVGVVGAYGLHFWIRNHQNWYGIRRSASETGAVIATVMVIGALYYPGASLDSRTEGFSGERSLDGTAFIANSRESEADAIAWLSENARDEAVLVEAIGGSYTDFGRISSTTGIPTLLGWPFHEEQWRGGRDSFEGREEDVQRIYSDGEIDEVITILGRYEIDYIVVGPRERSTYPDLDLDRFAEMGERIYPTGTSDVGLRDYVIFDVGGELTN
jgi:YYY domain-containing protein